MDKPNINGFIKWIENNKDEETGEYRKPRNNIIINGRILKINEITEEKKEELKYGRWWADYPIERQIYEKYLNIEEEKIPEKYRKFIKKMKEILLAKNKITIEKYLEWIKNHKYEITGIHRKPRSTITRNGKQLKLKELTSEEKIEIELGKWWIIDIKERAIFEKYCYEKLENIPKENREMIEIIKSTSVFTKYIQWRKNHFDKETGEYKKPRLIITRNEKK